MSRARKSTGSVWHHLAMSSRWWTVVIDAHDPAALARFWTGVLDWSIFYEADDEVVITKDGTTFPGLVFVRVPEAKQAKNRLHLDLAPDDQAAEVERVGGVRGQKPRKGSRPTTRRRKWSGSPAGARRRSTSARATSVGSCSPIPRATSSVS